MINTLKVDTLHFEVTKEEKDELMQSGSAAVKRFLGSHCATLRKNAALTNKEAYNLVLNLKVNKAPPCYCEHRLDEATDNESPTRKLT